MDNEKFRFNDSKGKGYIIWTWRGDYLTLISNQSIGKIQSRWAILFMVLADKEQMVSQSLSTILDSVEKTSFLKLRLRISFQICSIGFISGVQGGKEKISIFGGILNSFDLCQAAPSAMSKMTELYVEIHDIGRIEQRTYSFDSDKSEIGTLLDSKVEQTTLKDFAVQVLTNVTHSSSVYGVDDYALINSIVAKIMWRLHCIDNVLDKHSDPSISGPRSALSYDNEFQKYYLDLGKYFMRDSNEDPDTQYITWNGNLDAAYKEIDVLLQQLYTLSEMGQAFMEGGGGGNASSGTALKLRMVSPRIKATRLKSNNTATVKQVISLLAQVNGISINYDSLQITWNDGLPDDEVEITNRLVTATGGKSIMSQYSALKSMGLTDKQAEAELEQMAEEQANSMPVMLSSIDKHEGGED